jgi:Lar family restriction alleviation protein
MDELKPCPHCGEDKAAIHYPYYSDTYCCIQCYNCGCATALFDTQEKATEAWNMRADDKGGTENDT